MLGIYVPNEWKEEYFRGIKDRLDQAVYDQIIILGGFSGTW